jgi:excisionase family DNA binding protein
MQMQSSNAVVLKFPVPSLVPGEEKTMEHTTDHVERFFTVRDAAAFLQVSERTVYDALRAGRMEGRRFGRSWRTKRAWIEAYGRPNAA